MTKHTEGTETDIEEDRQSDFFSLETAVSDLLTTLPIEIHIAVLSCSVYLFRRRVFPRGGRLMYPRSQLRATLI